MANTTNTTNTNTMNNSTKTTSNTNESTSNAASVSGTPNTASTSGGDASLSTLIASKDAKSFSLTPPMVDVRGWTVTLSTGATVGTVDRIMLDGRDQKPRYLAVTPSDRKGHMLLPIGVGTLDREHKRVVLEHLKPEMLKTLPLLTSDVVTRDLKRSIFGLMKGAKITDQSLPQIYTDPLYDAARLFGSRVAPAGA